MIEWKDDSEGSSLSSGGSGTQPEPDEEQAKAAALGLLPEPSAGLGFMTCAINRARGLEPGQTTKSELRTEPRNTKQVKTDSTDMLAKQLREVMNSCQKLVKWGFRVQNPEQSVIKNGSNAIKLNRNFGEISVNSERWR